MKIIKTLRERSGKTLRDIESLTGLSNAYLSLLERGKIADPSAKTLFVLAKLYGVTVEHILVNSGVEVTVKQLELKKTVEDRLTAIEQRLVVLERNNLKFS